MVHQLLNTIIGIAVSLIIVTGIVGAALTTFFATTTTTWGSSVSAVWGLLAILALLSIALAFYHVKPQELTQIVAKEKGE